MADGLKKKPFWNIKKALWYSEALKESDFPEKVTEFMKRFFTEKTTLIDIGAGCGSLSIPFSRYVGSITAFDPSLSMIEIFKREAEASNISNIDICCDTWKTNKYNSHDIAFCANVAGLFNDHEGFLKEVSSVSKKYVFLIHAVGPGDNKFFFKELYPVIFDKPFATKSEFIDTYKYLHDIGIYANIHIIDNNFDQRLKDLDEGLDFWKEQLSLDTDKWDSYLYDFLSEHLEKLDNGGYIRRIKKKSAIIWWQA